jgi:sugar lactone lactonase YvrE
VKKKSRWAVETIAAVCMLVLIVSSQASSGLAARARLIADEPSITSVSPAPPYCLIRGSIYPYKRLLVLGGENFPRTNVLLQFRKAATGDLSIHFGMEVNFESSTRITLDMKQVKDLLWSDPFLKLNVRLTDGYLNPLSTWSGEFNLTDDEAICGVVLPPVPLPPLPPREVSGDLWADVIIGQPSFGNFTPGKVIPDKLFDPGGVVVDRSVSPGRMYVWDSGNSRVLGVNLATCYGQPSACHASVILGQPANSALSGCNGDSGFQRYPARAPASAQTLCGIGEDTLSVLENKSFVSMAVDASGNLYVPDFANHRLLKYNRPFSTDAAADEVWGQTDFTRNACNQGADEPTADSLCFHQPALGYGFAAGVDLDSSGNIWVADAGNNRVVRFPRDPVTGIVAKTANLVLGQAGFSTYADGDGLASFRSPSAVRFRSNGYLYVADALNHRVLEFIPPFHNGMSAARVFGHDMQYPNALEMDPGSEGLWVNDFGDMLVELWDWDGNTVRKVIGKDTFPPGDTGASILSDSAGGIGIDAQGNLLVSAYVYNQDVLKFAAPIPTPAAGVVIQPEQRLFSPPYGYNSISDDTLHLASGVAVSGEQLIASDGTRLMYWNGLKTLTNGKAADGIIGSSEQSWGATCCNRIKPDAASRLWVADNHGSISTYPLPLAPGASPAAILAAGSPLDVLGGGSIVLGWAISDLQPTGDGSALWISDSLNNRVIRVRNPLSAPLVDVIIGQTVVSGNLCNRGIIPAPNTGTDQVAAADMLCRPGGLGLDREGNLFVSDHDFEVEGNWRMLVFKNSQLPENNPAILLAPAAEKIFPHKNDQPALTFAPAFDATNRMVVGYNSYSGTRFVGVFDDPLGANTNPNAYLKDFSSMPFSITFDHYNNLYVMDSNRNRILIYWNPFDLPLPPDLYNYLPLIRFSK